MPSRTGYHKLEMPAEFAVEQGEEEQEKTDLGKLSNADTFWNMCNAVLGLSIFAMPLATLYGGCSFIFGSIAIAFLSNYTSKILVRCVYEDSADKGRVRVRNTYADIGDAFWPTYGRHLVDCTKFLELIFISSVYPIACSEAIYGIIPFSPISQRLWVVIFGLALVPNVFLDSVKYQSKISFLVIFLAVAAFSGFSLYCVSKADSWRAQDLLVFDPNKFPLALGVVTASYSCPLYLTIIEGNMRHPEKFNTVVNSAYVAMTIVKVGFGVLGYLTFTQNTADVVTNNLPSGTIRTVANVIVLMISFLLYSLPMYAIFDMVEHSAPRFLGSRFLDRTGNRPCMSCTRAARLLLTVSTILIGVLVPHFIIVVSFVGSATGSLMAFVFPCLFHAKILFAKLHWFEIVLDALVFCFGVFLWAIGTVSSGREMVAAFLADTSF